VLITRGQYLATHYEREPEYARSEGKDKPIPDAIHAWIERMLLLMITPAQHRLIALPELRCQIGPDVYRRPILPSYLLTSVLHEFLAAQR
jgi:hypothetical protein